MKITDEDRAEAERLELLPKPLQREVLAAVGSPADDPEVPDEFRREARRRERALASLLGVEPLRRNRKHCLGEGDVHEARTG